MLTAPVQMMLMMLARWVNRQPRVTTMRVRPLKGGGFPVALAARMRPNRVMSDANN